MSETTQPIAFDEVLVGDRIDVYTSLYRRPKQLNWVVEAIPNAPGYEGLILKSKGAGNLFLPKWSITKIILHEGVQGKK